MSSVGAGANASDVGLIVQGTLILLSSLVAVSGYFVQAKMRSRARERERATESQTKLNDLKLERVREKASVFIGPAAQMAMTACRCVGGSRVFLCSVLL